MKKSKLLLALGVIISLSPLAASAQPAPPKAPAPAASQQTQYSDTQLKAFANAALEVDKVARVYQPKLASANNQPAQAQKIEQEANTAMVKAIQAQGLQPEEYKEMHQSVQQNPALLQKVQGYIQTK